MSENLKKAVVLCILATIVFSVLAGLTGCGTKESVNNITEESVESVDVEENLEDEIEESATYELLESIDIDEMFETVRKDLVVDSNKRDVDKDSENVYVVNKTILAMYNNEKIRRSYEEACGTTDTQVVVDSITKDVADYMNKELSK